MPREKKKERKKERKNERERKREREREREREEKEDCQSCPFQMNLVVGEFEFVKKIFKKEKERKKQKIE